MLAFGNYNKLIILNILNKKVIKEIRFPHRIWRCKFSNDSHFIFIGDDEAYLY